MKAAEYAPLFRSTGCADPVGFVEAVIEEWTPRRREDDRF